jgi:hypothetical protein
VAISRLPIAVLSALAPIVAAPHGESGVTWQGTPKDEAAPAADLLLP